MAQLLDPMRGAGPARSALTDPGGALTWADLDGRVDRWTHLLRAQGLAAGDRVALVAGNYRETFEALLACLHSGLIAVPVNWHLTGTEMAYLIGDSGSRAVIADEQRAPAAARAVELCRPGHRVVFGGVLGDRPVAGLRPVEPLLRAAPDGAPEDQIGGSAMLYTSGSTGRPRGVVLGLLPPGAQLARTRRTLDYLGSTFDIPGDGRMLLCGPWYHSAQLFFALFPLLRGSSLTLTERFDPAGTLDLVDRDRITHSHFVPTQFIRLLRLDPATRARFRGGSLIRVWHGGGPCPVPVKRSMIDWWGPVLTEYYGATESGIATLIDSAEWLRRPGSVGRAAPHTSLLVCGADGAELPPGTPGQVYLRRPAGRTFAYHNAPEQTRAAHHASGAFTYGDVGYLDGDGYLYLTGRAKDVIVSGGVNIYPAEVEEALLAHPAVRDVAVVGTPDEEYGERVTAVVEVDPAAAADRAGLPGALDRHCRQRLAGFKLPRAYEFAVRLPRDESGKLRKHLLRDPAWRETAPAETTPAEAAPAETARRETAPAETARRETGPAETARRETVEREAVR